RCCANDARAEPGSALRLIAGSGLTGAPLCRKRSSSKARFWGEGPAILLLNSSIRVSRYTYTKKRLIYVVNPHFAEGISEDDQPTKPLTGCGKDPMKTTTAAQKY